MNTDGNPEGPVARVLERVEGARARGDGYEGLCPAHEDTNPSLSIGEGDDGRALVKCFAGCTFGEIVAGLGLRVADMFPDGMDNGVAANGRKSAKGRRKKGKKIVERYEYTDEAGNLLFEVVRFEPKGFGQRRPDGKGGWIWNLDGVEPVLYRLPKVVKTAKVGGVVYVFEGEKDVHAGEEIGVSATTNPMGADKWRDAYSEALAGAEVVVVPDNDEPGRKHAESVAESLKSKAAKVKVVELPGLADKGDVSDWIAAGGTVEELERLAGEAPEWEPPASRPPAGRAAGGYPPSSFNATDLGNAERLVARHGDDLRHVGHWGRDLVHDGKRWVVDETAEVERMATETVRSIYGEAERATDEGARKELARHAMRSESRNRIEAMIALARSRPGVPVKPDDLDADPWLLNCENGTLDLRTGKLRAHDRADLITKLAPVRYDPGAEAPTWVACLERWLPSEALRRFVQKVVGYAITGDVSEQVLPFLYGPGANGKSTLVNALLRVLGDYGQQAAPDLLVMKRGTHPTELADLKGARFVPTVEVEDGRRLAESLVKQLTGGDRIKARYMRQDFFEFDPTHKVFLAANHKPEVRGTDHAIWRRIKLIPFEVTIPKEEQDAKLPEKLKAEMPGILAWAVEGCLAWQREGLGEPEEVRNATASYRDEQDVLAAFVAECCVVKPEAWAKFADLWAAYTGWCDQSGETAETKRRFGARLAERGFTPDSGAKNVAIRRGIALRSDREPDPTGTEINPDRGGVNEVHADVNPENPCKQAETGDGVNEGYPKVHINGSKNTSREVNGNSVNPINPINPSAEEDEALASFLEDPPRWFVDQADKCVREGNPQRLVNPLANAVATELYGNPWRWREILPAVEHRLGREG